MTSALLSFRPAALLFAVVSLLSAPLALAQPPDQSPPRPAPQPQSPTAAPSPAPPASPRSTLPNIVLILADDLGIHDLGCYGRRDHRTPHLDRLASQGLRFTSAYAPQPICSPSRAALMTGLAPARLHLTNFLPGRPDAPSQRLLQPRIAGQLPLEESTLPELLKRAGYATGIFGKWHLGGDGFGPREQGFDVALSPPATNPPTPEAGGKGELSIAAAAEKFIADHRHEPFFCYVPHNSPHIPLSALPHLVANRRDAFNPAYAAMVETLDESVGRVLQTLDSLDLAQRTIVIFASDNGGLHVLESSGTPATHNRPYRAGKGFLYEGGLRVPLLIRWPGRIQPAAVSDAPVLLTDLVPTLLAAAGLDPAKQIGPLDGLDLAPLFRNAELPSRSLCWHFPHYTNQGSRPAGALRDGPWKLVEHYEDGSLELYHLLDDPGEATNLAPAKPAQARLLRDKLAAWRTQVGAQMPTPNPAFDPPLHQRLYSDQDPSTLIAAATAVETSPAWRGWRDAMNSAIKGKKPSVTPATGDIRLLAQNARIHGQTLRYEREPNKNVLGYWTDPKDWAEWEFTAPAAGRFEVEIQQGCGKGSGGAQVNVTIDDVTLPFTVQETGHFQQLILRTLGEVQLTPGPHRLSVQPQSKPGPAVMDLRRITLRPVP